MRGVLAGAGFRADAVTITGAKASKVDKGAAADGVVRFATAPATGETGNGPPGQAKKLGINGAVSPPRGTSGWLDLPGGVTRPG